MATRRLIPVLAALAMVLVGGLTIVFWPKSPTPPPTDAADTDPRRTYAGPYRNVRPEIEYVGDERCVGCHKDIAAAYAQHPMGRSLAPLSQAAGLDRYDAAVHNPFVKFGNMFSVVRRDGKIFHREERKDDLGQPIASIEAEAAYVIGSGTRGKSYVIQRGGFLFQSPISWFSEAKSWDISPGFQEETHFNRPLNARCLVCHCNRVEETPGAMNHFSEPVFRGHAIGCERCHGPGQLHVARREKKEAFLGRDYTIVNPKDLEPALRDAVCEQCHLQGDVRLVRRGRETFDFRPGLPLESFWSVFVRPPDLNPGSRSVGQVEQLRQSKCHTASEGKLGCISCHDPHERPSAERRVEYYRARCLECHADKGCKLDLEQRRKQEPADNCIACHMSKAGSSNIPHTAVTDHRILRQLLPKADIARPFAAGELPIAHFHGGRPGLDAQESARDLGVALIELNRRTPMTANSLVMAAQPLIESAVARHADDVEARLAQGTIMQRAGHLSEALTAYERALAASPREERALVEAAQVAEHLVKFDIALTYWQRAIAVNPWLARYHFELGRMHAERREWANVRTACEAALEIEPLNTDVLRLHVLSLLRTAENERAKAQFETLLKLRRSDAADLRRWFDNQMKN